MKIIGLTGSFGTGKTFVASVFASYGAKVLDADAIAHGAIAKGGQVYKKIVAVFGDAVLDKSRNIDRRKLAGVVFGDKKAVAKLNRIVHPQVVAAIRKGIKKSGPKDVIVIDAPLLIEANLARMVDELVVVKCSKKRQIERCVKKFRIGEKDVLKRMGSQIPMRRKIKMADFVIDSNGTKSGTKKQVEKVWREILWK